MLMYHTVIYFIVHLFTLSPTPDHKYSTVYEIYLFYNFHSIHNLPFPVRAALDRINDIGTPNERTNERYSSLIFQRWLHDKH